MTFEPAPRAASHVVYRGTLASIAGGSYDHVTIISDEGICPGDPMWDVEITETGGSLDPAPS